MVRIAPVGRFAPVYPIEDYGLIRKLNSNVIYHFSINAQKLYLRSKLATLQCEKRASSARRSHYRHILNEIETCKKLSPATLWEERISEVKGAEQRNSDRGRDTAIAHFTDASNKLKERYKIIEDAIEAKVEDVDQREILSLVQAIHGLELELAECQAEREGLRALKEEQDAWTTVYSGSFCPRLPYKAIEAKVEDVDQREILSLVQAIHGLELELAECQAEREGLRALKEEQDAWTTVYREDNGVLLEIVRSQQELINENNVQLTPEITTLYSKLRIGGMAPLSVLPRIQSGVSLALSDDEDEEDVLPTALNSPTSDTTPVFTKTYNVTDLEGDKVERDITQTTIHVLSTPSLTDNTPKPPVNGPRRPPRKGTWKVKKRAVRQHVMELDPPAPATNILLHTHTIPSLALSLCLSLSLSLSPPLSLYLSPFPLCTLTDGNNAGSTVWRHLTPFDSQCAQMGLRRQTGDPSLSLPDSQFQFTGADWNGGVQGTSDTLVVRGSMGDIPNTGSSLPLPGLSPGLQAKKAIQLQRLRALKTEPVAPKPAAKRQKKNVTNKTYSKPLAKSDNLPATVRGKMAEKAKIYGAPKRPRSDGGRIGTEGYRVHQIHSWLGGVWVIYPTPVLPYLYLVYRPDYKLRKGIGGVHENCAIQLQRLRALKTEPVAPKPAAKRQKKNVTNKTYSKPLAKSDNLPATVRGKMAEKAKIYGAPKRPRKARNGQSTSQLTVTGSTKKFQTHNAVRVFR
eukprot:sb/3462418/